MVSAVVSLDCMGGENAPHEPLKAAENILVDTEDIHILLVGNEERLLPLYNKSKILQAKASIVHAPGVIPEDCKASVAMRKSKNTGMRVAIEKIKEGKASCMISAGNTGALMAISMVLLKVMNGVERPAILIIVPGTNGPVLFLDAGANVSSDSKMLMQFAVMGSVWAEHVLRIDNPRVALLNIGSEESKGSDTIREAARLIKGASLNFIGYIEPNNVLKTKSDVVVCDGLLGNIFLKSSESMFNVCMAKVKEAFARNLYTKIIGALAKPVIKSGFDVFSADNTQGGILAGLNGVVIKTHGASKHDEYERAIRFAIEVIKKDVVSCVGKKIDEVNKCLEML